MNIRLSFLSLARPALIAAIGSIILIGSLALMPGAAHAASKQTHSPQQANAVGVQNNCDAEETDDLVVVTDFGWDVDCFHGTGVMSVALYDVFSIQTGVYITTFTWKDYDNDYHATTKEEETFLAAGNASANAFGGYGSIAEITSITIADYISQHPTDCTSRGMGVYFATHIGNAPYYVLCRSGEETYSVVLDGVYTLYTGDYNVLITWYDYNGVRHISSNPPKTLLAAGNAAEDGFGGSYTMALVTGITLSL